MYTTASNKIIRNKKSQLELIREEKPKDENYKKHPMKNIRKSEGVSVVIKQPANEKSPVTRSNGQSNSNVYGQKEMFSKMAICQTFLYNAWLTASTKAVFALEHQGLNEELGQKEKNKICINIFENEFTDLFKSEEYQLNLNVLICSFVKCYGKNLENTPLLNSISPLFAPKE
ncbi:MAG: hypothetical protein EPO63_02150 [Candidatus Nitrosotenuis sp.]|nr:MAG: hypothetical protein EPO63_02150 [Candidatus Nitrosotenuis sp.]